MGRREESEDNNGVATEEAKPPMEFVVLVLESYFSMNREAATQVMLHVHTRGKGVCGVYARDVAETKVTLVNQFSRDNQHPLLCQMEET